MKPLLLLALLLVGCTHGPATSLPLRSLLVLEPDTFLLREGAPSPISFVLRNSSPSPLSFCLTESGVSLWMKAGSGQFRPLVMYGAHSGGGCPFPVTLGPGEGLPFKQKATVPEGWAPPGNQLLVGALIRVHWPPEIRYTSENDGTIRTPEFNVQLLR